MQWGWTGAFLASKMLLPSVAVTKFMHLKVCWGSLTRHDILGKFT